MTSSLAPQFNHFLEFAHHLADLAGKTALPHFRTALDVTNKAENVSGVFVIDPQDPTDQRDVVPPDTSAATGFDPVTMADKQCEKVMRQAISAAWPDHGILGEEYEAVAAQGPYCWILDPIDGTRSFVMGTPLWGTLIGLNENDTPYLGMMNQPFTGERFWSDEAASFYRGPDGARQLQTRKCSSLNDAILATTDPMLFTDSFEAERFATLRDTVKLTRYSADCYAYCLLAAGFVDIIIESGLHAYDIQPLIPIISRAGGQVTSWEGGDASTGGRILATGDKNLHEKALKLLAG